MDGLIHVFKAAPGTPPMFSTTESQQKVQRVHRRLLVPVIVSTVVAVLVWWAMVQWGQPWVAQLEPQWLLLVGTLGMFGAVVAVQTLFINTFMPWLAYRLRGWRGPGQVVLSSLRIFIPLITVVAFLWLMVW
jgi:pheromone shutdown protein TraB